MGQPIGAHLVASGAALRVFDLTASATAPLVAKGDQCSAGSIRRHWCNLRGCGSCPLPGPPQIEIRGGRAAQCHAGRHDHRRSCRRTRW
ncbi:MAG: hypothetical protein HC809_16215, partial [Gammaproteobacteria bacterium]|nr:hypothetical protein [Gammaproteobacteria bacterium]